MVKDADRPFVVGVRTGNTKFGVKEWLVHSSHKSFYNARKTVRDLVNSHGYCEQDVEIRDIRNDNNSL